MLFSQGKEKGWGSQYMCYKVIRKIESTAKIIQYRKKKNQPSNTQTPGMGSPKPRRLSLLQVSNEEILKGTSFLTLPPHKFKISHKALVSSSKHGVTFVRLLSNNLVATLT